MNVETPMKFGPSLIGQTEKALDAILVRELEGTGVSAAGWVILKLAGGEREEDGQSERLGRQDLVDRAQVQAKFAPEKSEPEIAALLSRGMLVADGREVVLTPAARELQARVVGATDVVRGRLWGDLPQADLATAGRVLEIVLTRANAELGYSI